MATAENNILKISSGFAILTGILSLSSVIEPYFPKMALDTKDLIHSILVISTFVSVMIWLSICALAHKNVMGKIGLLGYVLCVVTMLIMIYWLHIAGYKQGNLNKTFATWNSLGLFTGSWGFLVYGITIFKAGIYPRFAVIFWTVGFAMEFSGLAFEWVGHIYMMSTGLIWCGISAWLNKKSDVSPVPEVKPVSDSRFESLDLYRGLIMILMALDHTSGVVTGKHGFEFFNMTLPSYFGDTPAFLTRFITHFCAPGFFFLMGVSVIFYSQSRLKLDWSNGKIIQSLFLRGGLIILLERILWNPLVSASLNPTSGGVLFGLGGSLIICAFLWRLKSGVLFIIGISGVLITQFLPTIIFKAGIYSNPLVLLFLLPKMSGSWSNIYPVFPWLSISLLGMAFGREIQKNKEKAFMRLLIAGVLSILIFIVVRRIGGFGNLKMDMNTGLIGFLNVVKYPPSLVFTLITLGCGAIVLCALEKFHSRLGVIKKPFLLFGKTALFFYFCHWFFYMGLGGTFYLHRGGLIWVYSVWMFGLIMLYPLCMTYLEFKQKTSPDSLWRFI